MQGFSLWKIRASLLLAIFGTLIVFAAIGWGIDTLLGTAPKALIGGIVLSFPVSNFLGIRFTKSQTNSS